MVKTCGLNQLLQLGVKWEVVAGLLVRMGGLLRLRRLNVVMVTHLHVRVVVTDIDSRKDVLLRLTVDLHLFKKLLSLHLGQNTRLSRSRHIIVSVIILWLVMTDLTLGTHQLLPMRSLLQKFTIRILLL